MFKRLATAKKMWVGILELLAVLIITIPAYISLLNPFYFSMHDTQQIARLYLLNEGIQQGYLYPRWVDILGFNFGYPLFNFYPPFVYYIGEVFHLFGFSFVSSIKLVFILGFVLGAIGIYFLVKRYTNIKAGFVSATLYTYFFYHSVLIYTRGALAEFFTLAILPFVFLTLDRLRVQTDLKNSLLFGIVFALLILNHPLIAVPFLFYLSFICIFYFLITKRKRLQLAAFLGIGVVVGLSLSAFFWAPSMFERKFTMIESLLTKELANYKIHFVCWQQFLYSPWGQGGSIAGCFDGMSFQLGKIHLTLVAVSIIFATWYFLITKKINDKIKNFLLFLFLFGFSILMMIEQSSFLWDRISYLWYLQFPWRFLTFTTVIISILGGYGVFFGFSVYEKIFPKRKIVETVFTCLIIVTTVFLYKKYFKPASYLSGNDSIHTSFYEIADRVSRTSFEFAPVGIKTKKSDLNTTVFDIDKKNIPQKKYEVIQGKPKVTMASNTFKEKIFHTNSNTSSIIRLNTFYFPGWTYYLDGKKEEVSSSNQYRLITVSVPAGFHTLTFRFENTPVRRYANFLSFVALIFTAGFFVSTLKLKRHRLMP